MSLISVLLVMANLFGFHNGEYFKSMLPYGAFGIHQIGIEGTAQQSHRHINIIYLANLNNQYNILHCF
jgi:hypothetical protein